MSHRLIIQVLWSDIDVFKLRVSATNGRFAGTADVYVGIGGLAEAAAKLKGFPLNQSDQREVELGSFGSNSAGGAVRLRFYSEGGAVRTFVEASFESDYGSSLKAETAQFITPVEAHAVDTFVCELEAVEANSSGDAELKFEFP